MTCQNTQPDSLRLRPFKIYVGELRPNYDQTAFALCPICTTLTALGEARPDLVEHLLVASREMLLAVRALIDARLAWAMSENERLRPPQ